MNCYGTHSGREECRECELKNYCREFTENDRKGDLGLKKSDAPIESVAALERFAQLPAVYEEPGGGVGYAFHALAQYLRWITTLSAGALKVLRCKIRHPDWQAEQLARATGMTARSVRNKEKEMTDNMTPTKFLVFICGPMTGIPDWNHPAFYDAEERLTALDIETINPAGLSFIIPSYAPHAMFVNTTCAMVRHCAAVVRLPGWENSRGAHQELETAVRYGVPIFDLEDALAGALEKYRRSLP